MADITPSQPGAEPSMEDILASIRRILNDDASAPAGAPREEKIDDDVLLLDESMLIKAGAMTPEATSPEQITSHQITPEQITGEQIKPEQVTGEQITGEQVTAAQITAANDHRPEPAPALYPEPTQAAAPHITEDQTKDATAMADIQPLPTAMPTQSSTPLLDPQTQSAAAAALDSLAKKLADERAPPVYRGGPTLEELVREEIRPVLKAWLDSQLPDLVERLVRVEIERLTAKR